jgi:hypothetical protein
VDLAERVSRLMFAAVPVLSVYQRWMQDGATGAVYGVSDLG